MKVYITKYALTAGIHEREVELSEIFPKMVTFKSECGLVCINKPYWHLTIEEANEHAFKMVCAKLASVDKQRKKLLELREKLSRAEQ